MTDDLTLALADRMFTTIEEGDLDAVRACYDPGIIVWANIDGKDKTLDQSLRVLEWLCSTMSNRRYDVKRRELIAGGFLQEHVLCGTAPDGTAIAMPACLVVTVVDGLITRINEYLDPAG